MPKLNELAIAAALGALVGIGWWAAYTPLAYPLWALVGVHALGCVAMAFVFQRLGWGLRSLVGAVFFGLIVLPAALVPLHDAGRLGGPSGLVADLVFIGAACLIGGLVGRLSELDPMRKRVGAVLGVVGGAMTAMMVAVVSSSIPDGTLPTAKKTDALFPYGPVLVFGIDGADWQVVDPLMDSGQLPNLQALLERGRGGVLRSAEPMASPVVWTTIFTGVEPSTHGVASWLQSDARSRRVPMLWDIFGAHDRSTLTVNVPGTWPPNEVAYGRLVSGFPMPGIASGDTSPLTGSFFHGSGDLLVASPEITGRFGPTNTLIDTAAREGLLPIDGLTISLALDEDRLTGDLGEHDLPANSWSDWLPVGDVAYVRVFNLGHGQFFVTPPFQNPLAPRQPFATGELSAPLDGEIPYIVEPIGWTAHRDERVDELLPGLLLEAQERQIELLLEELSSGTPDLVSVVFTATDRLQHPYWSLHVPERYAALWRRPDDLRGMDPVVDAYIAADEALGRVLEAMPSNTLVFIVSDHGVSEEDEKHKPELGEAGHRSDGLWIAAGPSIEPSDKRTEFRVVDVVPTLMSCMGAPLAKDFEGRPAPICSADAVASVESYVGEAGSGSAGVDGDQLDQIKSLGYMED